MLRIFLPLLLLSSIIHVGCSGSGKTEKEEAAFWNNRVADSTYAFLYRTKNKDGTLALYDSLQEEAGRSSPYTRAARAGVIANYHYFFTGDNEATARAIDSALSFISSPELRHTYPRAYVNYLLFGGQIAYRLLQYSKANDYYFRAKTVADEELDPCERTAFNYNIAMVLYRQQNFKQSLNYFKEAYALQSTCAVQTTAIVLQQQEIQSNIGLCYLQLKGYDSALAHFDTALEIADQYRDSLGPITLDKIRGVVAGNKAEAYLDLDRLDTAEALSLKSIALNAYPGYERTHAQGVQLKLAEVYNRKGAFPNMIRALKSLRADLDTLPNATVEVEWRRLMSTYYEQMSLPQPSLFYFTSYIKLRDSLAGQQTLLTAADVNRQLRDKEQLLQITLLKKDKQLSHTILWVTILLGIMGSIIILLIYQNYRRSKRSLSISLVLNQEIKHQKAVREEEAKQQHKQITEAVIRGQEMERSLIGLELHDNVNQVLTTAKLHNEMVLDGLGDPKVLLTRSCRYLQDCIDEIRSLSRRLSAPTLGKISLEESVTDLLASINLTNKVKITHQISGLESQQIKQDLHLGVYRIIQEQLNNVLKHADATEVMVKITREGGNLHLSICDNGKGFNTAGSRAGIGLMNMRTRAENLNGAFSVHSSPGTGCGVEVIMPCN